MRWSSNHTQWLSRSFSKAFQDQKWIASHVNSETLNRSIYEIISQDFQKERDLEKEVREMMNQLESQNASFDRQKMYSMLKKKLAQKKGIIL